MSRLLLFDIDGTLLLSGGAGVRAMGRAFEDVFGVRDGFDGIPVAGHRSTAAANASCAASSATSKSRTSRISVATMRPQSDR